MIIESYGAAELPVRCAPGIVTHFELFRDMGDSMDFQKRSGHVFGGLEMYDKKSPHPVYLQRLCGEIQSIASGLRSL
jgi:hypothetical protein